MMFNELPQETQNKLNAERTELHKNWYKNDAYNVTLVNKEGTRYFYAHRVSGFNGVTSTGDYWKVKYGAVQFGREQIARSCGVDIYEWQMGKRYAKSANGTKIEMCCKKKEVIEMAKAIGIFEL